MQGHQKDRNEETETTESLEHHLERQQQSSGPKSGYTGLLDHRKNIT